MVDVKRKFIIKLSLIVMLINLISGCSRLSTLTEKEGALAIEVPAFSTIEEYSTWAEKNGVNMRLIDSEGKIVEMTDYGSMLAITSESILTGETLDIVVCRKGVSCVQIMINDPMKDFNRN